MAAALLLLTPGCGGDEQGEPPRGPGVELAARLPSTDALNVAIADVDGIRAALGMPAGAIPPTKSGDDDIVFLDETAPALGIVTSGEFPQQVVDEALRRAGWVVGVAGDEGVTAITIDGGRAELREAMRDAGLSKDDGEYVPEDKGYAIALGDGLIAFADDPGDAEPVVADDPGDAPEELEQLDGDGALITLARFGADCVDAVATIDTPGRDGEIAIFTTATPDPDKVTTKGDRAADARAAGDSVRVTVPAAAEPHGEPPALLALQDSAVDYDCGG